MHVVYGPDGEARVLSAAERERLRREQVEAMLAQAQTIDVVGAVKQAVGSSKGDGTQAILPRELATETGQGLGFISRIGLWPRKRRPSG
jgi:hypothetical protein